MSKENHVKIKMLSLVSLFLKILALKVPIKVKLKKEWIPLPSYLEKGITQSSGHPPIYSLEKYKREPEMD